MGQRATSEDAPRRSLLRSLPSIDELLHRPSFEAVLSPHPRPRKVAALRMAVDRARTRILKGEAAGVELSDVDEALRRLSTPGLERVINATGVVLHTNLGRSPLAAEAADRVRRVACGYSNLELDLGEGGRGNRCAPVEQLLQGLTGAEAAVVVNNNAAAVLLALSALAKGREAVVSRGELLEIGGGFRIPDVMRESGAHLVEVGTTNRTYAHDYRRALGPLTGLLVKVERSNFVQSGYVSDASISEVAEIGRRAKVPLYCDLGSGELRGGQLPFGQHGTAVAEAIASGATLVSFSADKLLGGPQAGIVVGRAEAIALLSSHPLYRALRVDKMTLAALEATLEMYRDGRQSEVPVRRMLAQSEEALRDKASRLSSSLSAVGVLCEIVESEGQVGGGSGSQTPLGSYACAVDAPSAAKLQRALWETDPAVIARVSEDKVLLDVRCIGEDELSALAGSVRDALERS